MHRQRGIMRKSWGQAGGSLAELAVVLVVVGLVVGLTMPRIFVHLENGRVEQVRLELEIIDGAINRLYLDAGG